MDDRKKKNMDDQNNESSTVDVGNDTSTESMEPAENSDSNTPGQVSDKGVYVDESDLIDVAEIFDGIAEEVAPTHEPKREKFERNEVRWVKMVQHNVIIAAMVGAGGSSLTKYGDPDDARNIVRTIAELANRPSEFSIVEAHDGNHYSANDYQIIGGDIGIAASIRSIYMTMDAQEHAARLTVGNGCVMMAGDEIANAKVLSPDGLRNSITRLVEASKGRFNPPLIAFSKNDHAMDEFEVIPLGPNGYLGPNMREFIVGKGGSLNEVVAYLSGVRLPKAFETFGRTIPIAKDVFFVESLIPQLKGGYRKEG